MKTQQIKSAEDADSIIEAATLSAAKAIEKIGKLAAATALRSLWSMKIEPVGCDLLDCEGP